MNFPQVKEVEWADQKFYYEGTNCKQIEAIEYGVSVDKEHLFAEGDDPIGIQSGNRTPSGSLTLLKSAVDAMNVAAVSAGGRDLTDLQGTIVLTYKAQGIRPLITVTLSGVEFMEFKYGWTQGAKNMPVQLPFKYMGMAISGI